MAKKPSLTVVGSGGTGIAPPRKLGKVGLSVWNAVQTEYRIEDRGGSELLVQMCSAIDRLEAISARISDDGEVIHTRTGLRSHPLIREETALRAFVCRTLERLGITQERVKVPGRPGGYASWVP